VIVSTISLKSQDVVDAQGNVTATRNQTKIADDASHVGVYTITFNISANDEAGTLVQTTFRYFNASGQLWQIDAPAGAGFVFPLTKSERHLTPDGSRVLLVSSTLGNTDPSLPYTTRTDAPCTNWPERFRRSSTHASRRMAAISW